MPPEMMKAPEKLLKASIICSTRLKKITGASSGMVMAKNCLELAGRVDLGGFVEFLRYGAEAGEEDQHGRAELPDREDDDRPQRIARIGEPGGAIDADQREDGIEHARRRRTIGRQRIATAIEPPRIEGR